MQSGAAQPDADSLIAQGLQLLDKGKAEEALGAFTRATEIAPSRAEAWGYRGVTLNGLAHYEEAVESLQKSLSLDATDAAVWQFLGEALFDLERMQEAADAYNKSIELDSSNPVVWASLSAAYVLLRNNDQALETVNKGLAVLPGDPRLIKARVTARKGRVRSFIDEERYADALATADEALEEAGDTQRGSLLFFRGMALNGLERYQEAFDSITEAEKLEAPQRGSYAFCLHQAIALTETGRYSEALSTLDSFDPRQESDESRSLLLLLRGAALNGLTRHGDAYQALSGPEFSALSGHTRSNLALQRAVALTGLKRYAEALPEMDEGLNANPPPGVRIPLLLIGGAALNALERHAEALEHLEKACQVAPPPADQWAFWMQYGAALNGTGRYSEAEEPLEAAARALEKTVSGPDSCLAGIYALLTAVRSKVGKPAESLEALDRAIAILPPQAAFWLHKADLLQRLDKLDEALDAFDQAALLDPGLEKNINVWAARAGLQLRLRVPDLLPPSPELEGHPMTLALRGGALLMAGRMKEAWPLLRRAEEVPASLETDPLAWVGRGMAHVAVGRFEQALQALAKATALVPEIVRRPGIAQWHALALQGVRESQKALEVLADVPDGEFSRLVKALALSDLGRNEEALALLDSALEPEDSRLRERAGFMRSVFLMKGGRLEEALKQLDDTLEQERNPLYRMLVLSLKALVLCLARQDNEGAQQTALELLAEAESLASALPEGMPSRGLPWFAKGVLLSSVDRHDEAVVAYRRSEQMETPRALVVVSMGQSLLALEDYDPALGCFKCAMDLPSDRAGIYFEALVGQGLAYYKQEQHEKAVAAYRSALEQPAEHQREAADAWTGLAETYAALGRFKAAVDSFNRALASSNSAARTAARAGWIFLRSNREQEALHFLDQAKRLGHAGPQANFNRGVALYRLKRVPEARDAWKTAAQSGSEEAKTCLRELARRAPGASDLLDYWFGEDRTTFRKTIGTLLIVMGFAGAALPVLKIAGVPWIHTGAPWAVVTFPATLALGLLFLPVLSSIKLGPLELKLAPVETPIPLPHASIEAVIDQALSSRAVLTSPPFESDVQPESLETKVYASYAVGPVMPVRVER